MNCDFLNKLIGKTLIVYTLEGARNGVLESIEGDFIYLVTRNKKTNEIAYSCYVNINMISQVDVKNK